MRNFEGVKVTEKVKHDTGEIGMCPQFVSCTEGRQLKADSFLSGNYSVVKVALFLLLFLAALVASTSVSNAAGPNLLTNNGFEQSSTGWTANAWDPPTAALSIDATQRHSGTSSAKIYVWSLANDAWWIQAAAVNPNTWYRICLLKSSVL